MDQLTKHLIKATESCALVRVARHRLERRSLFTHGYAVGLSSELLLLHSISDRIDLDGYETLRVQDITGIEDEFPKRALYARAAELKRFGPVRVADVDLSNVRSLVTTAQEQFALLVINREQVAPDECEIGRIRLAGQETYVLQWMTPEATWEPDNRTFPYSEITRVGFGGEYETTLAMVAGVAV